MSSRVVRIKAGVRRREAGVRRDPRCPKRDPHLWSGRGALKHLLVGSMLSLLAKSLGKGQGGTETFVPLKPIPHMASQSVLGTHMGDLWSANVATTRHQPKLVKFVGLSLCIYYTYCKIRTGEDSVRFCLFLMQEFALYFMRNYVWLVLTQVFKPNVVIAQPLISRSATLPAHSTSSSSHSQPVAGPSSSSSHSLPAVGTSSSPHSASPSSGLHTPPMAGPTFSVANIHLPQLAVPSVASIHPPPVAGPSSSSCSPVAPTTTSHPAPVAGLSRASTLPTIAGFQVHSAHERVCLMYYC